MLQNVSDLFAATLGDHAWAGFFSKTINRGADHVVGVLRPNRLCNNVLNAQHLEHGAHRTTGDDAGTVGAVRITTLPAP